ncbi:MAG: LysR family transcriptional regulator [Thermomicrobiales bacterium]|jgi:DNA-binding transcriptional LysR family regulator|nr:LysR family transcriptional regulator [Thermomicrobiales bacterium]
MLPAPLNFNRLRLFLAVAEQGSVTRAAEALHISQPAVTRALHELERDTGLPLVEHVGRGIALTEAGRLLASYARRLFDLVAEAERALDETRGLRQGRLAVGASTTIGIYLLPEVLGVYRAQYPGIELFLDIGNTTVIAERLQRRLLDIALVEGPVDAAELGLAVTPYRDDDLVLIVAPGHSLAGRRVTSADLAALQWILREPGSGTRAVVDRALAAVGITPQTSLELGSTEAIKRAVAAGLGVSIVSHLAVGQELALGRLAVVPVDDLNITRQLTILQRVNTRPQPVGLALLRLLSDQPADRSPARR